MDSRVDGLSMSEVQQIKLLHTQIMHALGRRLRLRQRAVATGVFFFRRFFAVHTLLDHDPLLLAATALWMASKVEECHLSANRVVRELGELGFSQPAAGLLEAEYVLLDVVKWELAVAHPFTRLSQLFAQAELRKHVGVERSDALVQAAWFVLNDCFRTDLVLVHPPATLAMACMLFAGLLEHTSIRHLLPEPTAAEQSGIESIAAGLHALYEASAKLGKGELTQVNERLCEARARHRAACEVAAAGGAEEGTEGRQEEAA